MSLEPFYFDDPRNDNEEPSFESSCEAFPGFMDIYSKLANNKAIPHLDIDYDSWFETTVEAGESKGNHWILSSCNNSATPVIGGNYIESHRIIFDDVDMLENFVDGIINTFELKTKVPA